MRAYHLLEQLSRRHEVTLISFGLPGGDEQPAPLGRFCHRVEIVPSRQAAAMELRPWGLLSPTPRYHLQTFSREMLERVKEHAPSHDAVVAMELSAAIHVAQAAPRKATVFEGAEAGAVLETYKSTRKPLGRLRRWLTWCKFRRFLRFVIQQFDETTVVSRSEQELMGRLGCDLSRITVVQNGTVLYPLSPPGLLKEQLAYTGSVRYSANLDAVRFFVSSVLPQLRAARPSLKFVVTGSTDDVDIGNLAQAEGVTFTGRLPEVRSLIAESLACVVPLRQGGGTRLKILEAMAVGTPVVSTSKGIEGLDVEADHHLLIGDTPEALAEHILRLVREPGLASTLTRAARRLVSERYGWETIGHSLDEVIRRAVDRHRGSLAVK